MASDSDIDEDELLQMALNEQSERDLGYKKPSGKAPKPVVNLVQPPSMANNRQQQRNPSANPNPRANSHPGKSTQHQRKASRGSGADDDDDSEVEMLSISSGDEESSKDHAAPQRGRVSERRASRDDGDLGLDGDEPRSWKRVDEAELARRVREMRETRTAPSLQEQKATGMARKVLTSLQSLPRGVEVLDPLGLGVIDNKSLRLITDASVSSPVSRERSEPLDPSIREKVIYSSPNFDPKIFLVRVHQDTSAAALESAAHTLKTDLKGRTQQKKQLVKENFDCFISCKTTIDDIQSKLNQIEEDPEGAGTARLYEATQNICQAANHACQPLLERQVQADKIRSVQGMLQRFRTLFNLPSAIRGSIAKGEYDFAVREYRKAKSIVLPSHVGILKRVLEEVEKVMDEFRWMLYKSMEDPELELADLENIVMLLLELEPSSDPVWRYLNIQNRRIRNLIEQCTSNHEAQLEFLHNEIQEKVKSDARWRQLQQDANKLLATKSSFDDSLGIDSHPVGEELDVLRGRYIHMLNAVLIHHIPAFWRLSLSVFSGKFGKVSTGSLLLDSETSAKSALSKNEKKAEEIKYSTHTLEEVAAMIHGTVSALEAKVHSTFREFDESNILKPYMSDAIKEVVKACQALEGKESAPSTAVKALHHLHFEITKIYILRLCSRMRTTTKEIPEDEMWTTLTTLERNRSPYAISYLPFAFRAMTISAMDRIDVVFQCLRNETMKYQDISEYIQEIQESVRLAFLNSFLDFAGYLERIGSELSQRRLNKENSHLQNGYLHSIEKEPSTLHSVRAAAAATEFHKKLLIILSNIGYCKDELSSDLYSKYKHIWLQNRDKDEQNADTQDLVTYFSALEEKVLGQYTCAKSDSIREAAYIYLLNSGIQWGGAPTVKGIRDATVDLLHMLVSVHAEVFSGAKPLLEKVLGILVEGLIDTLISLFNENKNKDLKVLDTNGFCQLMLELEYFETVLHTYFSPQAHEALKTLQGLLLEKACENTTEPSENPGHNRKTTRASEDIMVDDKQPTVSPDDLLALAQQYSTEMLEGELERTRLNIVCFMESSLQPTSPLGATKPAYSLAQGPLSSPSYRKQQTVGSPAYSRQRRK